MNHADLKNHVSNDFWSLLVYSGYLTVGKNSSFDVDHEDLELRIPNKSILSCFRSQILDYFKNNRSRLTKYSQLVEFIFKKDPEQLRICIDKLLNNFISIRDFSKNSPKEDYYHGFLNGIFTSCEKLVLEYHSNYESGNGYPDITFKAERNTKAVIIEIKATSNEEDMDELATNALSQIEEKNYAQPFIKQSKITEIYAYGLVFCNKDCLVTVKKLK